MAIVLFVGLGPVFLADPTAIQPEIARQGPSWAHMFGTDQFGRDILSRVSNGGRQSLLLATVAVLIGLGGGLALGTFGPYKGGALDRVVVVAVDSLFSFPPIILAMLIVTALGPGIVTGGVAVGVAWVPYLGRVIRGEVLTLRQAGWVEAGQAAGSSTAYIIGRHILPNLLGPLLVVAAYALSDSIVTGAGLGFLGLGVPPPASEWGSMLGDARNWLAIDPEIAVFPGTLILLTSLGGNLLADGLQDVFNPHKVGRDARR